MANVNEAFLDLENNYVFSEINEKLNRYKEKNKDTKVISLGIGDVSLPLAKTVIDAMQKAVEEMSKKETFKGYGIVQGYDFLIEKILKWEYERLNINLKKDEIFIASRNKRRFSRNNRTFRCRQYSSTYGPSLSSIQRSKYYEWKKKHKIFTRNRRKRL